MNDNKIAEWIKTDNPLTREMFDNFKVHTRQLTPSEQILFIKKVINEIEKKHITLTIKDLLEIQTYSLEIVQDFGKPKEIDYTIDLILQTIKLIDNNRKFPNDKKEVYLFVKDLADFICDYLKNNVEYLKKINLLFDNCIGRTTIVKKTPDEEFINLNGNDYKIYSIYKGFSIINKDKTGWGEIIFHHENGIYAKGKACMIEIKSKKVDKFGNDKITYGDNIKYNNKLFPFKRKKDGNNYLITPDVAPVESCEGRKSPIACNLSGKDFWWCFGRKCFKANQTDSLKTKWENYSLKDILNILKLPFDEIGYYIFVSEINRLNRLLERIKCNDCHNILRPSNETHFGFYRVSQFHCNNENHNEKKCPSYHKAIYLTHCLNSKCTNIIDSRVAKRCPNGFIICDKCGSCCSNDQFDRRIQNLKTTGQGIPKKLFDAYKNKTGHWEKFECYCYKCQKKMTEDKGGGYICHECNIHYAYYIVYIRYAKDYETIREMRRQKNYPMDLPTKMNSIEMNTLPSPNDFD